MQTIKKIGHVQLPGLPVMLILLFCAALLPCTKCVAQNNQQMVRLAKIKVDSAQLEQYNTALKTQMATAVHAEAGVLTYYAVADKANPTNITILEIYADTAAYKLHINTPHFKKYKETVKNMVRSLELVDVTLIGSATKPPL